MWRDCLGCSMTMGLNFSRTIEVDKFEALTAIFLLALCAFLTFSFAFRATFCCRIVMMDETKPSPTIQYKLAQVRPQPVAGT